MWIQLLICSLVHVFGKREYYSNIKGEHIDAETLLRHAGVVAKGGGIVYDSELGDTKVEEVPILDDTAKDRLTKPMEQTSIGSHIFSCSKSSLQKLKTIREVSCRGWSMLCLYLSLLHY